jgi:hypothetical protein
LRVTRDAYISGTLYLNNVTVFGTQSVAYISSSQLNIGTNLITVNTDTPSIRFGGLAVYDSGSTGLTGSLLWDSQNNHWVYSNPSGSSYSGGMFISGPRTSTLGSETGTTSCALMMGQGGDHITSSAIFSYGNATCFYGTSYVSASGDACFASTVCASIGVFSSTNYSNVILDGTNASGWGNNVAFKSQGTDFGYVGSIGSLLGNTTKDMTVWSTAGNGFRIYTNGNNLRLNLDSGGVACFSDTVCANTFKSRNLIVCEGSSNATIASSNNEVLRIQGSCQQGMFITYVSGSTIIGDTGNSSQIFSSGDATGFGVNARGSRVLQLGTNQTFRMTIAATGETTFACSVNIGTAGSEKLNIFGAGSQFINVKNTTTNADMFVGMSSALAAAFIGTGGTDPIVFSTAGTERMRITSTGIACFACQVCAPQYITTQGSSVSYAAGTNYIVWNSEGEICSQDNNTGGTYTTMKTWIADRTGCLTLRFAGYIQAGPNYWAWRVVKNGTSSFVCGDYQGPLAPGCSSNVHAYTTFQSNIGSVNPGDCITLQMVSSTGGGTPVSGTNQYLYAKELRLSSTTPNFSAGSPSNIFGDRLGVGTNTPCTAIDVRLPIVYGVAGSTLNSYPIATFTERDCAGGARGLEIGVPAAAVDSPIYLKVINTSARFSILDSSNCQNLTIAGGSVTKPFQPFVYGGLASDQTIGISNPTKVNFVANAGHFGCNVGSNWNNSTNQFTAPITGVYLVNLSGYWSSINMINQFAAFVNNARKVSIPTGYCTNIAGGSMMVPMASGETMDFRVYNDVGTGTLYQNVYHTFFSIYLLG